MDQTGNKGVFSPPDGLSSREQARWWMGVPALLQLACKQNAIHEDVFLEIEQCARDNDLAMKIADRNKVDGLSNHERARLFFLLTDGGELGDLKQGRPSTALLDLRMANEIRNISDPQARAQSLHDAIVTTSGGMLEDDSIRRRISRVEGLWQSICHFSPETIDTLLRNSCEEDRHLTMDQIIAVLSLLEIQVPE